MEVFAAFVVIFVLGGLFGGAIYWLENREPKEKPVIDNNTNTSTQ